MVATLMLLGCCLPATTARCPASPRPRLNPAPDQSPAMEPRQGQELSTKDEPHQANIPHGRTAVEGAGPVLDTGPTLARFEARRSALAGRLCHLGSEIAILLVDALAQGIARELSHLDG